MPTFDPIATQTVGKPTTLSQHPFTPPTSRRQRRQSDGLFDLNDILPTVLGLAGA